MLLLSLPRRCANVEKLVQHPRWALSPQFTGHSSIHRSSAIFAAVLPAPIISAGCVPIVPPIDGESSFAVTMCICTA
ncbi:hypothetical protein KL938_001584 [Ogataea parapolymorpha]|nr:hypothetical protein KL938_001584 [Ogataea parapolymorpha]